MRRLLAIIIRPWREAGAGERMGYGCAVPAALIAATLLAALVEAM